MKSIAFIVAGCTFGLAGMANRNGLFFIVFAILVTWGVLLNHSEHVSRR